MVRCGSISQLGLAAFRLDACVVLGRLCFASCGQLSRVLPCRLCSVKFWFGGLGSAECALLSDVSFCYALV